ncbi:MAG: S41 family peptidase [Candidatus Cloacimonadota bacterium]|nr:S41 family peptidase [Candidatus Cloacimonadota bacterium]
MFKKLLFIIFLLIGFLFSESFAIEPHFMKDPAISPDGETVCFSYMSDLWIVPFKGGEAKRIIVSKGEDSGPVFSPDGKWIAFNSNRDGQKNIYIIPSEGGEAKCISKEGLQVCDWFNNGKKLLASGYEVDLGANLFSVRKLADEKRPTEITAIGDFYSKLSPDNKKIIFNRGGMAYREAYHGSINGELWEYDIKDKIYTRLTNTDYTERYPVYSYVNDRIYFAATKGRIFQLYYAVPTGRNDLENRIQISNFDIWSVRDIDIARENDRIVFERFDEIWKYNPQNNKVDKLNIEIKQDCIENFEVKEEVCNSANKYAISPDGKLIAFCYKYDLFAVPEKDDEVKQITFDQIGIIDIVIMPDNHTIFFTRFEEGQTELYKVNIRDIDNIEKIKWFSNGKFVEDIKSGYEDYLLVYYSDEVSKNKLASLNFKTGKVKKIISDHVLSLHNCAWSKDGRYLLYVTVEEGSWDRDLYIYDFETKEKRLITPYHGWIGAPYWGMKGDFAFFTEDGEIYKIELQAKEDFWDEEDNWKPILAEENKKTIEKDKEEKGKEEEKKEKKEEVNSIIIDFEDIDKRIYELVSKRGNNWVVATITDSMICYLNSYNRKYTLRKVDYKGKKDEEFYKFSAEIEYLTYNETNKCFYYVENNSIKKLSMDKKPEVIEFNFKYKYNRFALNKTVFEQAWTIFGKRFYDPNMHGQDWKALYKRFHPYMDYAYTPQIMDDIISEMIGELDASHTGFYPRDEGGVHQYEQAFGGFILDYFDIPNKGIRFKKIFRKSKLNMPYGIKPGDVLLSVDGVEINSETAITPLFLNKVDDKIKLEIQVKDSIKTVEIKGLSPWKNRRMNYDNWVDERRELVDKLTDSKVGYAHIRSMGHSSYVKFVQDIFARNQDKDALIIDVRNNPGGWIHDLLVELLTKKSYAYTTNRLFDARKQTFPSDTWEKPLILLINEHSFSDAEIFPILFKQLNLGKVVGMPTCGAVIGTGHIEFMDGSSMRMPRTGWFTPDDINMEGMGAKPDILVDQTPEQKIADDDVQLKRAIEEILREVNLLR